MSKKVLFRMMIVTSSVIQCLLKKSIESYGIISLHYDCNNEKLKNWKNKLYFKTKDNIEKNS